MVRGKKTNVLPEVPRALVRARAARDSVLRSVRNLYALSVEARTDVEKQQLFIARAESLEKYIGQFEEHQEAVLNALTDLDLVNEFDSVDAVIADEVEEKCGNIKVVVQLIKPVSNNIRYSNDMSHASIQSMILPRIEIPKFDGNIISWCSFRDMFQSLVHENHLYSDIERFHYLTSCVSGPAASIVKSVPLSAANYRVAWTALIDRFDNQRLLATAHIDQLFAFKPIVHESLAPLTSFVNTFRENIAALKTLGVTDLAGFLLFYIGSRVLDSNTRQLFEDNAPPNQIPDLDSLITFVQRRCKVLEIAKGNPPVNKNSVKSGVSNRSSKVTLAATTTDFSAKLCLYCNADSHQISRCFAFKKLTADKRKEFVTSKRLCFSCLRTNHMVSACPSKATCAKCGKQHNTLLHLQLDNLNTQKPTSSSPIPENKSPDNSETPPKFSGLSRSTSTVVLGTAVVRVLDRCGVAHPVRALIDSGSQVSVITLECASRLDLRREKSTTQIVGLSKNPVSKVKGKTRITFMPHHVSQPVLSADDVIILPEISGPMPANKLPLSVRERYKHLLLADPKFDSPSKVDLLIGGDRFPHIMQSRAEVLHHPGCPSAFETLFGWVIVGSVNTPCEAPWTTLSVTSAPALDTLISRFWAIEEPGGPISHTTEDELCEKWFTSTVSREPSGKFCVALPFRQEVFGKVSSLPVESVVYNGLSHGLGDSYSAALKRLFNLELKLSKDAKLYEAYRDFMDQYLALGHMKLAAQSGKYYIPHHAVVKHDGDELKIRVVFDASASTTSKLSLNDVLCVGPKLQTNIDEILLKSRLKKFVFTADIVKMYRQIRIRAEDCTYQHILWRRFPSEEVQDYELLTVTYGVSSAPYLAIRCLHELDTKDSFKYPRAKGVLTHTTYVDDIITGADTEDELLLVQQDVIGLLRSGACELKKWSSNSPCVLRDLPVEDCAQQLSFDPKEDQSVKVLGLHWDTQKDAFAYHTNLSVSPKTKRGILSTIARLFDPIGALGPTILWAKCIMQQVWQEKLGWDETLPSHIHESWDRFVYELPLLRNVSLPRHIDIRDAVDIQLLGFSDASQKAYAAIAYLRVVYESGKIDVFFLTCKTKVAPLKAGKLDASLSIPRLELCAALLLAKSLSHLHKYLAVDITISKVRAWTDSTTVLSWLKTEPKSFKIFVTNRIAKIHGLLPDCSWEYVSTSENPADPASRGLLPSAMLQCSLHWNGPSFARLPETQWPQSTWQVIPPQELPEARVRAEVSLHVSNDLESDQLLVRFSSLVRMQRSIAFIFRFCNSALKRSTMVGSLTRSELDSALITAVRMTQRGHFFALLKQLDHPSGSVTPPTLAQLAPFLDAYGIIRVGGRLRYSSLSYDQKHPILLPKAAYLTTLLIRHYHLSFLHGGPKLVLAMLSRKFWILSGRDAVRRFIYTCVRCTRVKASRPAPVMGDLPSPRVELHRPFLHVGMDYGGPFVVKESRRRNTKTTKVYLALFICMSVKAVHLEVVSDLTTDAFLAALDRFVARRVSPPISTLIVVRITLERPGN
ncbi:uncharacterized protein LOC126835225 [Adelges cooleyi]|uniref:uncharacterized protein LOC126835225 n=1 Tax=Adelges cooleyi TaxID=133065 RepID=UPI00217F695E|nr:uncharacterized protein LOC126835225 [Adelges cooleyi]